MHQPLKARLGSGLVARQEKGLLRQLRPPVSRASDFSSNDYLGLARPGPFQDFLHKRELKIGLDVSSGATGSRLLSGHSEETVRLEYLAARFHGAQSSLLFNSGYDANLSLLSCLPGRDDSIVYDELIHASVHDGMRMSRAKSNALSFRHNDVKSLKSRILQAAERNPGCVLVCIETVYSMDGDVAPLKEMLEAARYVSGQLRRDVYVIADEAHAGGLYGENGEGLAFSEGLHAHPNLLARVVTFGKAFAAHGAVILAEDLLKQHLINYARPFIYSTALPPHSIAVLTAAYSFAKTGEAKRARQTLWRRVDFFKKQSAETLSPDSLLPVKGRSPIQGILVPGNRECVELSDILRKDGFDVYPIRSPTVPRGTERIRIIIHAHNTEDEIRDLVKATSCALYRRKARL